MTIWPGSFITNWSSLKPENNYDVSREIVNPIFGAMLSMGIYGFSMVSNSEFGYVISLQQLTDAVSRTGEW